MTQAPGFTVAELEADRRRVALAKVEPEEYRGLTMAAAPAEAQRRLQELQAFVHSAMVKDVDYGTIPGTDKPCLFQPGAQKLAEIYGFSHRFIPVEQVKDWGAGFFYFEYRTVLESRRDGSFIGEGIGSCNSRESKYAGRWVPAGDLPSGADQKSLQRREGARWCFASEIPAGVDKRSLQTQERTSKKTGGKYTVFRVVDEQFLVPNPDPYSLVNTLQKMAAKRSYVHAVIAATRSSGIFTQDVEDLPPEAFGKVETARAWEHVGDAEVVPDTQEVADPFAVYSALCARAQSAKTLEELRAVAKEGNVAARRKAITPAQAAEFKSTCLELAKALTTKPGATLESGGECGNVNGSREPGSDDV